MKEKQDPICEYVKLDPFNLIFYNSSENKIYIDEKIKGTELEKKLIEHEKKHIGKGFIYEPLDYTIEIFKLTLKYKPLHILQFLFPFVIGRKKDGSWIFGVDPLGLIILAFFIVSLSILIAYKVVICDVVNTPFGLIKTNCKICTIFGCKVWM